MNQKQCKAWAVEADGKVEAYNIVPTRNVARILRKSILEYGLAKKASIRKVNITVKEEKV
jgi:hypothetical protein